MFSTKGSSSYGKGIASNLVTEEQRVKYNSGGRVKLAYGSPWKDWDWQKEPIRGYQDLDQRYATYDTPYMVEGSTGVETPGGTTQYDEWGVPILPRDWTNKYPGSFWEKQKARQNLRKMEKSATPFVDEESEDVEVADIYQGSDPKYFARKFKKEDFGESDYEPIPGDSPVTERRETIRKHPLAWQYDTESLDEIPLNKGVFTKETLDESFKGEEGDVFEKIIKEKIEPGKEDKTAVEILKEKLMKDRESATTMGKVAAIGEGVKMASNLLTEPTMAKALGAAGKQVPGLIKAAYEPGQTAKKTERQFEMLEALQGQKDVAALEREVAKWEGRKGIYEFLDINAQEAAQKAFENKKEILDYAELSPGKGFRQFIADKGGDAFSMAQGINAFSPKSGFTAVAAEWQDMKKKKKDKLFSKNKGNVIVDGQGQMIYIAEDGTGHSITRKDLGLEDERTALDFSSIIKS